MRKQVWLISVILCGMFLFGCRQRLAQTETPGAAATQTEAVTETQKPTEPQTEAPAQAQTEKESETEKKPKTSAKQTTVKPSTTGTTQTNPAQTEATGPTKQCPYCFQQISTAPDGNGSTIYDAHVAQEKNWAELNGYGDLPPGTLPTEAQTEAPAQPQTEATNDLKQCGICYQWFTVSDGSYAAHIAAENQSMGAPNGTEYIICPKCGNAYPAGSLYDNHVCVTE